MKRALLIFTLLFAACLFAATKITNVSFDAEGTGNTITIPIKSWFAAGGCQNSSASAFWDMGNTAAIPLAVCSTGSNAVKGLLRFAVNTQQAAQFTYLLPSDSAGVVDLKFVWLTATASGTAQFAFNASCTTIGSTSTDDPTFSSLWAPASFTASATVNAVNSNSTTGLTAPCSAGQLLHVQVKRIDTAGTATNADVYGLEMTYRRAM